MGDEPVLPSQALSEPSSDHFRPIPVFDMMFCLPTTIFDSGLLSAKCVNPRTLMSCAIVRPLEFRESVQRRSRVTSVTIQVSVMGIYRSKLVNFSTLGLGSESLR